MFRDYYMSPVEYYSMIGIALEAILNDLTFEEFNDNVAYMDWMKNYMDNPEDETLSNADLGRIYEILRDFYGEVKNAVNKESK